MTVAPELSFRRELARKAIHLATALLPIAWSFGWIGRPAVLSLLSAGVLVALATEAARHRGGAFAARFDARFGALLRSHETRRICGATWLALGMWMAVALAPPAAAICALWAGAVGDATAAIAGRAANAWRRARGAGKSLVGSAAGALATAMGVLWLSPASWGEALLLGAVAALAEWPSRLGDDNLRVVLAVALAATLLGVR